MKSKLFLKVKQSSLLIQRRNFITGSTAEMSEEKRRTSKNPFSEPWIGLNLLD